MKHQISSSWGPCNTDWQLIADVQTHAGARCHESASLIQCYEFCAILYQESLGDNDSAETRELADDLQRSEAELRRFLWECQR